MDPSCGMCLGSDCRGFAGYTDPTCPEHGVQAVRNRQEKLERNINQLSGRTLRRLVKAAPPRTSFLVPPSRTVVPPQELEKKVRRLSERMMAIAQAGGRHVILAIVQAPSRREALKYASSLDREVLKYFWPRLDIRIVESWYECSDRTFTFWATW